MDEGDVHISKSCNSVQVWQRLRDGGVLGSAVPQSSHIYAFYILLYRVGTEY